MAIGDARVSSGFSSSESPLNPASSDLINSLLADPTWQARRLASIRITERYVATDRQLITLHRRQFEQDSTALLERIRDSWNTPDAVHQLVAQLLPIPGLVSNLHIGREAIGADEMLKIYLELDPDLQILQPQLKLPANTSHLSFKWDRSDPDRYLTALYNRDAELVGLTVCELVSKFLNETDGSGRLGALVRRCTDGVDDVSPSDILQVCEPGTHRESVDFKLPSVLAELDAEGVLARWNELQRHSGGVAVPLVDWPSEVQLKRLATGRDRAGDPFVSFYFEPSHADSPRGRQSTHESLSVGATREGNPRPAPVIDEPRAGDQ